MDSIELWHQPKSSDDPVRVIVLGFASGGSSGSSAVAVYYDPKNPTAPLLRCPVGFLRYDPVLPDNDPRCDFPMSVVWRPGEPPGHLGFGTCILPRGHRGAHRGAHHV
jgi:hypothetical protein